ncbi:hypothetical protein GUJ93_ZPchr0003g17961 [Zizania palustris]|uniref:1-phosphatidylinositol-3-phosphate 5-kinase n=1 Tax=Zizania palustris TaxID=103762 RepID=A0A8J5SGM0_ZIZPA|nr:hypothetical protein GUJ93_ZPchr0003g17961 [Zizania palustris]
MDASDKTFVDASLSVLRSHFLCISPPKSSQEKPSHNVQNSHVPEKSMSSVSNKDETSPDQFGYYTNRSDDEDEECAAYCSDRQMQHQQYNDHYYVPDEFDDLELSYNSTISQTVEENVIYKEISPHGTDQGFPSTLPVTKVDDEPEPDNSSECGAASSIYALESTDTNPLDFEKNELFWLPPEPEDEEDEMEVELFDDDDDDDDDEPIADREKCRIQSSSSFGSVEFRSRDRSSEEHKKVMKNVVDGHFRALISQLLQVDNISLHEGDETGWLEIVISVSWEAANFLRPDTSQGGSMDPGGYVKVKCLACGHRSESAVVKGVVCKKNVSHRRMTSRIEKPRLLLLAGALEYHRVTNQLSSIDTLLQQETDHLKMAVAKIVAQKPNLLLVEKTVSRYAQDLLLEKNISLLGYCEVFYVDKYIDHSGNSDNTTKKMPKTMMFFEGCPKPLGCTVLLKGGSMEELKKIKHVVQYGIFAAYHLALETSFLADEGATLPEIPLKSPLTVALPDNRSTADDSISTVAGFTFNVSNSQQPTDSFEHLVASSIRSTDQGGTVVIEPPVSSESITQTKSVNSNSSGTWFANGGTLNNRIADEIEKVTTTAVSASTSGNYHEYGSTSSDVKTMTTDLTNANSSYHQSKSEDSTNITSLSNLKEPFDGSIDLANVETITNRNVVMVQLMPCPAVQNQETSQGHASTSNKEEFVASHDQSILVSLSVRCVWNGTICERSHMLRIKYYGNFDKPLGRFLRDCLFNQDYQCVACDKPPEAHVHCYTHQQGSLTISVRKLTEFVLPGERDGKIWMWHRCLKCPWSNGFPPATLRIVMSDAAWGLSLGKFLELSFSNHAAASRVASCGHSLHRDCLRFYGFGKTVACFRYAPINVHSIHVPPHKLDFTHQPLDWIQKEANEVVDRAKALFDEILRALQQHSDKKAHSSPLDVECSNYIAELEGMLRKEKSEFEGCLNKVLKKETQKFQLDILEINRTRQEPYNFRPVDKETIQSIDSVAKLNAIEKLRNEISGTEASFNDVKYVECLQESIGGGNSTGVDASNSGSNHDQHIVTSESDSFQRGIKAPLYSSVSVNGESVPLESDIVARRTLSEGQFPSLLDVSNVLDAKWTGENDPAPSSTAMPDSVTSSEDSELHQWSRSYRFDALNEYTPVHVSFLRAAERQEYHLQLSDELESDTTDNSLSLIDLRNASLIESTDETTSELLRSFVSTEDNILSMSGSKNPSISDPLAYRKVSHIKVNFGDEGPLGQVKYTVICYYAKQFDALRRICCPSERDFVRSLSRCKKWGAQGGKSNVFFAKSLDDRFIIKQVTKTELESFMKFAPEYFRYISESIGIGSPTCIAKILGIYQVKSLKGGKEMKMDVLVMENLLFERHVTRLYDLKGSTRSRYNPDSNGSNKVLLDQNLIEAMPTSPIFVGNKAKRLLERAVWNDTAFLASIDVMDYSLLVGVDEKKHELVMGIIDFMRQYTWDKHLETWVKASGILGGPKNVAPTVISPQQYKKRFRKAMSTYFLVVPDQWSPPAIVPSKQVAESNQDNDQIFSTRS